MPGSTFSGWLRGQLRHREWSENELASRLGTSSSVVNRWVRGERVPTPKSIDRLADVLGINVDHVLAIAGHRPADEDLSDRTVQLIERIRGARLSDRRIEELGSYLDLWEQWDREDRELAATQGRR